MKIESENYSELAIEMSILIPMLHGDGLVVGLAHN